jgi:putative FmdB family regulatory protein
MADNQVLLLPEKVAGGDMPIYEYRCEDCQKQMSLFIRSITNPPVVGCRFCHSQRLTRLMSRIVTPKSEESRLESLADPSALGGLDEQDPKSMNRWMKNMAGEMGEDLSDDMMDEMQSESDASAGGQDDH